MGLILCFIYLVISWLLFTAFYAFIGEGKDSDEMFMLGMLSAFWPISLFVCVLLIIDTLLKKAANWLEERGY